ncbi:hypothetical protein M408DRAFT_21956 [Serendipita vermifera MAFF 305830]|uniref:Uncharacterized protein n=1 Tax=Serendipita vermifera MAFF 305830 TaxID=933852 RepID=A0A0C2XN82_SERVB|nr:hypothetical protein M408DRAFT_21956 [Serendipita vermifera MAFF 305830]
MLSPTLISEEEGIKKPSPEIWRRALDRANLSASEVLHVGDDIEADYRGAREAGLRALLLQRPEETEQAQEVEQDSIISSLTEIPARIL